MIVECLYNTGKVLLKYPRKPVGTSEMTQFGELSIGVKYIVMGMVLVEGCLLYLIDSGRIISACPYQLFRIVDGTLPDIWFYHAFTIDEKSYSHMEAIWGYKELCFENGHYEELIEMNESAIKIYFKRKKEIEQAMIQKANYSNHIQVES